MNLLATAEIEKSYAGVRALAGVSFDLESGEVHAVVGENGAGKSTLIKILCGAETPDAGALTIAGQPVMRFTPADARARGVAVVYQQPALCQDLTVAENLALALEPGAFAARVNWRARYDRAATLLGRIGADVDPERLAGSLSLPEQQLVEIAKAVGAASPIVIFDEPTASLSPRDVERLLQIVRGLRDAGVGVLYVTHRLEEVFALADRITVLRDGQTVATRAAAGLTEAELVRLMVGRELSGAGAADAPPAGSVALEVRHLSSRVARLRDISLTVRAGEIVGMAGLVGSGRTELAEAMFGIAPPDEGEIWIGGHRVGIDSPATAVRHRLAYVPEDRRRHGVIGAMSIAANTTMASLSSVSRKGLVQAAVERRTAERYRSQLQIKTPSVDAAVETLSGGNQQKVALARWLATDPAVLILDEPTQGVDVGAKAEIHNLVRALAARGLAILMISSDLSEILSMSDRILVMRAGRIESEVTRARATAEGVMRVALGRQPAADASAC